jgi:hypothetical protein
MPARTRRAVFAEQLAKLYRQAGNLTSALAKATRAVMINPYNAPDRELAAADRR